MLVACVLTSKKFLLVLLCENSTFTHSVGPSVIIKVDTSSQCDNWGWALLVSTACIGLRHLIINFYHHGCHVKSLAVLSENFTQLRNIPGAMNLASPADVT